MTPVTAYVALGSNLENPEAQIEAAFDALATIAGSRLVKSSSLYRTAPVGFADQPDFINAVCALETALAPRALLDALLALEAARGRARTFANAPRTLDLDILLYGGQSIAGHGLTVPHPRMHERAFVLVPLAEIAPDCVIPGRGPLRDLLRQVDQSGVRIADRARAAANAS